MPFIGASENEAAGGREQACPRRRVKRKFPGLLSRGKVERAYGTRGFHTGDATEATRAEKIAGIVFGHAEIKAGRFLTGRDIEQARLRTVRRAEPVGASMEPWIHHGPFGRR